MYCFFFSSRRRHTRWPRDWSSDVCSSDLEPAVVPDRGDPGVNAGGVDGLRILALETEQDGLLTAVTVPGGAEGAVQLGGDPGGLGEAAVGFQPGGEHPGSAQRAHGVRAGRPDADLEKFENADHAHSLPCGAHPRRAYVAVVATGESATGGPNDWMVETGCDTTLVRSGMAAVGREDPGLPVLAGQRAYVSRLDPYGVGAGGRRDRGRPVPPDPVPAGGHRGGAVRPRYGVRAARGEPLDRQRGGDAARRGPAGEPVPGHPCGRDRARRRRTARHRGRRVVAVTYPATQPERTRLSWRRTVLTVTVVALLTLGAAIRSQNPSWVRFLGAAAIMLIWLTALVVAQRRISGLDRPPPPAAVTSSQALLAAGVPVGLAALGIALLVL